MDNNFDATLYQNMDENNNGYAPQDGALTPVDNEYPGAAEENKGSKAAGIAAAVAGSVAVGGLGAWGLYSYLHKGESVAENSDGTDTANQGGETETTPEPVVASTTVNNVTHVHHVVQEPAHEVEYVQLAETMIDGQPMIVGMMYDEKGHAVMLIDADHDGQFDIRATDVNDDGNFAQITDLHDTGETVMVAQFENNLVANGIEPNYSYINDEPATGEHGIELTGMTTMYDEEGNPVNVAGVRVDGQNVVLIDADNDGQYEYIAADMNGNGQLDTNELERLDEPIPVNDVAQFPHSEDFVDDSQLAYDEYDGTKDMEGVDEVLDDSLTDSEDDTPDYVNLNDEDDSDDSVVDAIDEDNVAQNDEILDAEDTTDDIYDVSANADDVYTEPDTYDVAYNEETESWPEPETDTMEETESWPEPETDTYADDFGSMGDEGINC